MGLHQVASISNAFPNRVDKALAASGCRAGSLPKDAVHGAALGVEVASPTHESPVSRTPGMALRSPDDAGCDERGGEALKPAFRRPPGPLRS